MKKATLYFNSGALWVPGMKDVIKRLEGFMDVKSFSISTFNGHKIEGLKFEESECPIILVGRNDNHSFAYFIFEEFYKFYKTTLKKEIIMDLRDYYSDCFKEGTGKSWTWVRRLVKDYDVHANIYCCKDHDSSPLPKKVKMSKNLPNREELKNLERTKTIITSLDMDFLYLNNFSRKDFEKIADSLRYERAYMDVYFFDKDKTEKLQVDFLEHIIKN